MNNDIFVEISNYLSITDTLSLSLTSKSIYKRIWNYDLKQDFKLIKRKSILLNDLLKIINEKKIKIIRDSFSIDAINWDYVLFVIAYISNWEEGISILKNKINKRLKELDSDSMEKEVFDFSILCIDFYLIQKKFKTNLLDKPIRDIEYKEKEELLTLFQIDAINTFEDDYDNCIIKRGNDVEGYDIYNDMRYITTNLMSKHIRNYFCPEYIYLLIESIYKYTYCNFNWMMPLSSHEHVLNCIIYKHTNKDKYIPSLNKWYHDLTSKEIIDFIFDVSN